MENLPEWLFPLIFVIVYFVGNLFTSKASGDEEEPPTPPAGRGSASDDDEEAAERQRRVQEEIRRKIMERRQGASGGGRVAPTVAPPTISREAPRRREVVERREQLKENRERLRPERAGSKTPEPTKREVASTEIDDQFTWDQSDDIYESSIEGRLRRIEATKLEAAKLQKQAGAVHDRPRRLASVSPNERILRAGSVRSTLTHPAAARTAFIYGEVLGPPKALQKTSSGLPREV